MEYYSTIKRNEVQINYNMDKPLKHYAVGDISQTQKAIYYRSPFT
jgi:hypothetical protein